MKPRHTPLAAPEGRRYWSFDVDGKGLHHFRAPPYGAGQALLRFAAGYHVKPENETRSTQEIAVAMLPCMGAVIAAAWHHRESAMETPLPLADLSAASLEAYGNRVVEELQEADYDLLDILNIFGAVMPEIARRQSLLEMAASRASFTPPPRADLTSS